VASWSAWSTPSRAGSAATPGPTNETTITTRDRDRDRGPRFPNPFGDRDDDDDDDRRRHSQGSHKRRKKSFFDELFD
jgi:Zn-finger nucleic acid-binding protein